MNDLTGWQSDRAIRFRARVPSFLLVVLLAACQQVDGHAEPGASDAGAPGTGAAATVVDSIRSIDEEVRLFRATLPEHPTRLKGGEPSIDALVAVFVAAVNAGDTTALAALAVTRAEFAYFQYPYSRYTSPPYELSPALVWYRLQSRSSRGLTRLLAASEGRGLEVSGAACQDPEPAGSGRLHLCALTVLDDDGRWIRVRLFDQILERDGRYKVVSFANEL